MFTTAPTLAARLPALPRCTRRGKRALHHFIIYNRREGREQVPSRTSILTEIAAMDQRRIGRIRKINNRDPIMHRVPVPLEGYDEKGYVDRQGMVGRDWSWNKT